MQKLLYLVHRIPYPPNKGDKIRSFHFLQALAEHYQIYLGTFIDDPADRQYLRQLAPYCRDICALELNPGTAKLASLRGLLAGEALSLPYYRDRRLQAWVDQTVAGQGITRALIFSSPMAQYLQNHRSLRWVADLVDVDSDKWQQYAAAKTWPMNWLYRREAEKLLAFERQVAANAGATLLVSMQEAQLLQRLAPEAAGKIGYVNNGVDSRYFDAEAVYPSPYPDSRPVIVFTGVMDYWANVDAVCWFAKQVMPMITQQLPDARFYIVGSKPVTAVLQLAANDPAIIVTGRVDDVRPYLALARLAVAPLRIARGVQNKVLEAMAMAKPVVVTSAALEGIGVDSQALRVSVADRADDFAGQVLACLAEPQQRADDNRSFVQNNFSWQQSTRELFEVLEL